MNQESQESPPWNAWQGLFDIKVPPQLGSIETIQCKKFLLLLIADLNRQYVGDLRFQLEGDNLQYQRIDETSWIRGIMAQDVVLWMKKYIQGGLQVGNFNFPEQQVFSEDSVTQANIDERILKLRGKIITVTQAGKVSFLKVPNTTSGKFRETLPVIPIPILGRKAKNNLLLKGIRGMAEFSAAISHQETGLKILWESITEELKKAQSESPLVKAVNKRFQ